MALPFAAAAAPSAAVTGGILLGMNGQGRRAKGAAAEREVAAILGGRRTGQMQSQGDAPEGDVEAGLPGWAENFHIEVKRQETLKLDLWCKQAEDDAAEGRVPLVIYRRSRQPWRVSLPLDEFAKLTALAYGSSSSNF